VTRQIGERYQASSGAALEERVHVLEARVHDLDERVEVLSEVIRVLAHGLEEGPTAEPGERPVADAARRAYDLLLVTQTPSRETEADVREG
jgi:hypothetical protein